MRAGRARSDCACAFSPPATHADNQQMTGIFRDAMLENFGTLGLGSVLASLQGTPMLRVRQAQ